MLRLLLNYSLIFHWVRISWRLIRDRRVPLVLKGLPIIALLYLLLPFDLVRDFLPLIGLLDDLVVVTSLILAFIILSPRQVVIEHLTGYRAAPTTQDQQEIQTIDGKITYED